MINRLKAKFEKHQALISNFNFMSILQISQIVFPLMIYPYLIRILGKETFGLIAYSNAIVGYLIILINFGFNISEIKEISVFRHNIEKVSEIVSSVLILKSVLTIISIFILLLTVFAIPALSVSKWLYFAYFGVLIDGALNTSFYFQGIEKMKFITIIYVISNTIIAVLTILLVKEPSDYILVPLFNSFGAIFGILIGLFITFKMHKLQFSLPPFSSLKFHLRESLPFFTSRISTVIIDKTNIVLIGSFIGYTQVAYYDLAAKFVAVMKAPFNVFNQVLFPNVSRSKNVNLVIKSLKILIIFYLIGYFSIFFLGEFLIKIIGGANLLPAKYVLYLLGITSITDLIAVFMGAPMLLVTGHKSEYNKSIFYSSFFYLSVIFFLYLINWIGLYQLTMATVCASTFNLLYRYYYCKIYKLL
jgi:O-antigen/teichoic acid export membrane protein